MTERTSIGVIVGGSPMDVDSRTQTGRVTPWGEISAPLERWRTEHLDVYLLKRHGSDARLAPHEINYRANVWRLKEAGVAAIYSTNTVGGVDPELGVGDLVLPEDLIDYTWGRAHTYDDERRHVDFTAPYDSALIDALAALDESIVKGGVYACTQGPRLESAAEVRRLARDGATLVGMTGMPEAALARELDIPYCAVCVVVNPAAGVGEAAEDVDLEALYAASREAGARIVELIGRLRL